MAIFLKLRKSPQNIIFSHGKQFFLIFDIILRIWVNFHQKIWIRELYTSILVKSANFGTFWHPRPTMVPNDTIFCQNVLKKSPNTVTERYLENLVLFWFKLNFEFFTFFRPLTNVSKTNKTMSYLKINNFFGFFMVDLVKFFYKNSNPHTISLNFFKEKVEKNHQKISQNSCFKIGVFCVIFLNFYFSKPLSNGLIKIGHLNY
jgi:hypothetical protein